MYSLLLAIALLLGTSTAFAPPCLTQSRQSHSCRAIVGPSSHRPKHSTYRNINRSPITQLQSTLPPAVDIALVASSITILSGYHIRLSHKEKNSSTKTWRQYQEDVREEWSRHVRDTQGWLYGIQSLRNAMTAQSFLASTVLSLLTLITGRMWDILRGSSNEWERRLLTVQLACISLPMLFSSYYFLQGVRLMTHAGFMFPVNEDNTKVDNIMRKTSRCQWRGLRWMYISLAPISWVVGGSRAFFVAACLMFQFFRSIDKKPEGLGHEGFQGSGI